MPCDLETTEAAACESGIGKIESETKLLQLIAQSFASWLLSIDAGAEVTVEAIEERACESGIGKIEDQTRLMRITAQNMCSQIT